jgi:hypothetical protein
LPLRQFQKKIKEEDKNSKSHSVVVSKKNIKIKVKIVRKRPRINTRREKSFLAFRQPHNTTPYNIYSRQMPRERVGNRVDP